MRVLLDTSAYSAFLRGHPQIKRVVRQADQIVLNPVVLGELRAGFRRGRKRPRNEELLERLLASPRVRTVDIAAETAERYAHIMNFLWDAGKPIPTNDIWIAASAMEYGLRLLTLDAHYRRLPQVLVDYFEPHENGGSSGAPT